MRDGRKWVAVLVVGGLLWACEQVETSSDTGRNDAPLLRAPPPPSLGATRFPPRGTGADGAAPADAAAPDGGEPQDGACCDDALALVEGITLGGDTSDGGAPSAQCRASDAPQQFYSVVIPVGQRAVITVVPTGEAAWRAVVRALATCSATGCLTDGESAEPGVPVVLALNNFEDGPRQKIVTVSSTGAAVHGTYTIALRFEPTGTAACTLPLTRRLATPTDHVTGMVSGPSAVNDLTCARTPGNENVDVFDLATAQGVTITASAGLVLALRRDCDNNSTELACEQFTDDTTASPEIHTLLGAGRYYVIADTPAPNTTRTYALDFRAFTPAPNATCAAATRVADGTVITGADNTNGGDRFAHGRCDAGFTGPVIYYSVVVGPGQTLTASALAQVLPGPTAASPILRLLSSCDATLCLALSGFPGFGIPSVVTYTNTSGAAQSLILAASSASLRSAGPFDLTVSVR